MLQICTDWFNLKQNYVWIAKDVITEKNEWDESHEIKKKQQDLIYINDMKLKINHILKVERFINFYFCFYFCFVFVSVSVSVSSSQNLSSASIFFN
jgi:hypothetical protein